MSKTTKIIIVVIAIAVAIVLAVTLVMSNRSSNSGIDVNSVDDLKTLVDKVYDGVTVDMYNVETKDIDLTDATDVTYNTGLENGDELEYAVMSEPLINTQPYSLIIAKVKSGVSATSVAKTMSENIDLRKWICVSADKLYATSVGDVVFLVMADEEKATGVFESFKTVAGQIDEVYEQEAQEEELPPDTVPGIGIQIQ